MAREVLGYLGGCQSPSEQRRDSFTPTSCRPAVAQIGEMSWVFSKAIPSCVGVLCFKSYYLVDIGIGTLITCFLLVCLMRLMRIPVVAANGECAPHSAFSLLRLVVVISQISGLRVIIDGSHFGGRRP